MADPTSKNGGYIPKWLIYRTTSHTHTHSHNHFMALWTLSGTTRVSR